MNTLKLILTILQLLSGLAVTVVVLLQSGKAQACPVLSPAAQRPS